MRAGLAPKLAAVLALFALCGLKPAAAETKTNGPKPSAALVRSLNLLERELLRLQQALPDPQTAAQQDPQQTIWTADLLALKAPPAGTWPMRPEQVAIDREVPVELPQALALAIRNDPDLAASIDNVNERRARSAAASGRLWPRLDLDLSGGFAQSNLNNTVWQDNAGLYPNGSPFLVKANGSNRILSNLGYGAAAVQLDWELISFERNAELAQTKQELQAARSRYGNRLRQLQLDVSLSYYTLQLAQQLKRVRQVLVDSDAVVLREVRALNQSGLVPRVDLLRAEAQLQQSRMKLEQAEAIKRSRQRQLSNLINVPYDISLSATEAVLLQPPWPLDLQQTLIEGFRANPELLALDATRRALISQADREAAELLPRLHLFAAAGSGQQLLTKPVIDLQGCCASAQIPQLGSQNSDWAAGLRLRWRLFDGGTSQSLASASRSAAARTAQDLARSRNSVRQQLESAFFEHRAALAQVVAARASFNAAREAFRDVRARYQLGLADYTDVSSTILLLTSAMEGVAESITLANVSYAQLLRQLLPVPAQPPASAPALPLILEASSLESGPGS